MNPDLSQNDDARRPPGRAAAMVSPIEALEGGIVAPPADTEASGTGPAQQERLAIRIGDLHLLCAPDAGREVLMPPPTSRLPHTPDWLLGVANVRGALVPVMDLSLAFGLKPVDNRRAYLLISGSREAAIGFLVDGLPMLLRLDADARLSGIPPHPELLSGHVLGAFDHAGSTWLDISLAGLFGALGERIGALAE